MTEKIEEKRNPLKKSMWLTFEEFKAMLVEMTEEGWEERLPEEKQVANIIRNADIHTDIAVDLGLYGMIGIHRWAIDLFNRTYRRNQEDVKWVGGHDDGDYYSWGDLFIDLCLAFEIKPVKICE